MFGHLMISALTGTFLSLEKAMGPTNLLWSYCVAGVMCLFYLYKHLPETENKSLHDIEEYFKKRNKAEVEEEANKSVWVNLCSGSQHSSVSKGEINLEKPQSIKF